MVLIKVDRVYELTILLCGLETERERERARGGGIGRECTCKLFARQKKWGVSERKESTEEGRVGGKSARGSNREQKVQ